MSADAEVDDLLNDIRPLLVAAYQRGMRAGSDAMREAILQAASQPLTPMVSGRHTQVDVMPVRPHEQTADQKDVQEDDGRPRAPRGLVKELVRQTLKDFPGLSATEVTQWVVGLDERVAAKTVGNELRRNDDIDYKRDGKKWFLINDNSAVEGRGMIGRVDQQIRLRIQRQAT